MNCLHKSQLVVLCCSFLITIALCQDACISETDCDGECANDICVSASTIASWEARW